MAWRGIADPEDVRLALEKLADRVRAYIPKSGDFGDSVVALEGCQR